MTDLSLPFTPRLAPISHQAEFLAANARRASFGLFWEQGTGKTKSLVDNVALLLMEGAIDGCVVLAPNGVHRNWVVEELPKHWPHDAPRQRAFEWSTTRSDTKTHKVAFARFLEDTEEKDGPAGFLCMSYDALMTEAGKKAHWDFLRSRRCMYILDESQRAKTPATARTKRVIASSVYAPYRRIASGTPMDKPFDIYSQVRFLDPGFWGRKLMIASFTAFKRRFAEWGYVYVAGGKQQEVVKEFRDLDLMHATIAQISDRVLKEDVLDLPPKTYKRMFHELTATQRAAYDALKEDAMAVLDGGQLVTATMALVAQMRLAQISSGFVRADAPPLALVKPGAGRKNLGGEVVRFTPNPRTMLLKVLLEDLDAPSIIWARFTHDVEECVRASRMAGRKPVVFDANHMPQTIEAWKRGEFDDLIGNLHSGMTEGHTLNRASTVFYYSNLVRLIPRTQSEDRCHRIGQTHPVSYIDLLASSTGDAKVLRDLRRKKTNSGVVLGDDPEIATAWLRDTLDGGDEDMEDDG